MDGQMSYDSLPVPEIDSFYCRAR